MSHALGDLRRFFSFEIFEISNLKFECFYDFASSFAGFVIIREIRVFSLSVVNFFLPTFRPAIRYSNVEFASNFGFRVSNFRTIAALANTVYD